MRKNKIFFVGMTILALSLSLMFLGCSDDNGDGNGGVAWTDLVGEWDTTSTRLKVNPIENATIGGVINYSYNVDSKQGGGSWIQCSISGTTLKIGNGEETFTFSLSADKKTLTLSNSSSTADNYKLLEGTYAKSE